MKKPLFWGLTLDLGVSNLDSGVSAFDLGETT